MNTDLRRQILGILDANGLEWTDQDGGLSMRFASAMVWLNLVEVGRQTFICLRAPVLRGVKSDLPEDAVLRRLNELNRDSRFGKWVLYPQGLVALEYDLLGDDLQEDELMTAVTMLARLADRQDDLLQREFGGLRSFE